MNVRILFRLGFFMVAAACMAAGAPEEERDALKEPVDLTKPHGLRPAEGSRHFNLGPTGMTGFFPDGPLNSRQIEVRTVHEGSPAHGKIKPGDVLLGVNRKPFPAEGGNLLVVMANAIDESETEAKGGRLSLTVWRDKNGAARLNGYSQYTTQERSRKENVVLSETDVRKAYELFPIDAKTFEVTLQLEVMGSYSETSPWDCPKVDKIRERGLKLLAERVRKTPEDYIFHSADFDGRKTWKNLVVLLALLASDNPEYVELVKQVTHKNGSLDVPDGVSPENWISADGRTWFAGYRLVYLGEYYHRTGDMAAIPRMRAMARGVAGNQDAGGTWGHGAAVPNRLLNWEKGRSGGNYGAMNQAGGVCFFGLALARKAGINAPDVDEAIRLSSVFNVTWVDRGACPYGHHHPNQKYDDINGKNGPPGLAFNVLGDVYKAKYFGLTSAGVMSEGYRTGHGNGTFANYWPPLAASFLGRKAVIEWMKNTRPYHTMLRCYDGSFVGAHRGMKGGGINGNLFDPTAMAMFRFCIPFGNLYMTGRGASPDMQATDREVMHLQDRIGTANVPWSQLPSKELISSMDTFSHVMRAHRYIPELVTRVAQGDQDVIPALFLALDDPDGRVRAGSLTALSLLGQDVAEKALPHARKALADPSEDVVIAAVGLIRAARTGPDGALNLDDVLDDLLKASDRPFAEKTNDNANALFYLARLLTMGNHKFATDPFGMGKNPELVRRVLERFLRMDPRESVLDGPRELWNQNAVVNMAGSICYGAGSRPICNRMFSAAATRDSRAILKKYNYNEIVIDSTENAIRLLRFPRFTRLKVTDHSVNGYYESKELRKYPGAAGSVMPYLRRFLEYTPTPELLAIIRQIDNAKDAKPMNSLQYEAMALFFAEVDALKTTEQKVKLCLKVLDPARTTWFRQLAAQKKLVELIGPDATLPHLIPYLAHDHWRLRFQAQDMIRAMKGPEPEKVLVAAANGTDPAVAAAALELLGKRRDTAGLAVGRALLKTHSDDRVLGSAAIAIMGGSKGAAVDEILDAMGMIKPTESGWMAGELLGRFEDALLLGAEARASREAVCASIRKAIPTAPESIRACLYYVIGRMGGTENLALLKSIAMARIGAATKAIADQDVHGDAGVNAAAVANAAGAVSAGTEPNAGVERRSSATGETADRDIQNALDAISWSKDTAATNVLLEILDFCKGTKYADAVVNSSFRRFVNTGKVIGQVPDDVYLGFAERSFTIHQNLGILDWIGVLQTEKSFELLLRMMTNNTSEAIMLKAAQVVVKNAWEQAMDLPLERRQALAALLTGPRDVITAHVAKPVEKTWGDTRGTRGARNRARRNAANEQRRQLNNTLMQLDALIKSLES
jgi:hypothetical protein